LNQEAQSFRFR